MRPPIRTAPPTPPTTPPTIFPVLLLSPPFSSLLPLLSPAGFVEVTTAFVELTKSETLVTSTTFVPLVTLVTIVTREVMTIGVVKTSSLALLGAALLLGGGGAADVFGEEL